MTASSRGSAATPAGIRRALLDGAEIGLLDVRPEGRFARGHPLFAASFPLGRLEAEAYDRLPRRSAPLVVYGDGPEDASLAVARLRGLGYTNVSLLVGGLDAWETAGGELFRDVNAPSKAFGELVAETAKTPAVAAGDLAAMLDAGADVVVVDARRAEEYQTMSIPTATSVPGAELVLRAGALAPDPATTVVVNCAGRTRSIIGTQSLINAGMPNPVLALRNGTIGWTLAGLALDHGRTPAAPHVDAVQAGRAHAAASAVAARAGVRLIAGDEVRAVQATGTRTVYCFDVRTPQEYAAGHPAGFRLAPGGQLVQETDWFAPMRGALVVLADDDGGRAAMTASWLAQMGWDVALSPACAGWGTPGKGPWVPSLPPLPDLAWASPAQMQDWLDGAGAIVIDVDTSPGFRAGHVPGAAWALRTDLRTLPWPQIAGQLGQPAATRLVLTSADGTLAAFAAAADLPWRGDPAGPAVFALAGGTSGWAESGRPMSTGQGPALSRADDVYRRPYEGASVSPEAMQDYLDWEYGLVAQLERDGTHGFSVLSPAHRPD